MSNKQLNIGLFGFGVVGKGLYDVLHTTPTLQASIKKIVIKNAGKKRSIAAENFTTDASVILNDANINVIVELIDDADAAFEIVKTALQNGKAVVSANKKMIAEHFEELLKLQQENNTALLYEAACCACASASLNSSLSSCILVRMKLVEPLMIPLMDFRRSLS